MCLVYQNSTVIPFLRNICAFKILTVKCTGGSRHSWDDNIRIDHKEIV